MKNCRWLFAFMILLFRFIKLLETSSFFFNSFRMVGVSSAPWAIKTWKKFFDCNLLVSLSPSLFFNFLFRSRAIDSTALASGKPINLQIVWKTPDNLPTGLCYERWSCFMNLHIVYHFFIILGSESSIGIFIASNTSTVAANSTLCKLWISVCVYLCVCALQQIVS